MNGIPSAAEVDAQVAAVTRTVLADIETLRSPRRSRRFRIGAIIAVGVVTVSALTAGGLIALRAAQEEIAYSVACYEGDTLTSRTVTFAVPESARAQGPDGDRARVDPVATCEDLWRLGVLGDIEQPPIPGTGQFPVPDVVGCVQTNGIGAGFRREFSSVSDQYFCARLGMRVWRN